MIRRSLISAVLVVAGFTGGLVLTGRLRSASDSRADVAQVPAASAPRAAAQASPAPASGGPDFTRIAAQTVKGVVNISSLQVVRRPNSPFANDPFFSYFFGDQDAFGSRDRRSLSLGSGVIVSADGYVVTNNHVVGENQRAVREVTVALADKREIHGTIIGTDPATDIALLKIDVKGLPVVVPWGNSSRLQVGEWVLAIGSPFQLSQTVTAGIVSATGRANVGFAEVRRNFIQTDAAINPGNSGGALINVRGELVGINTGIVSQSGGPGHRLRGAEHAGAAHRGRSDEVQAKCAAGPSTASRSSSLTPDVARQLNMPGTSGALVIQSARSSDGYAAGLRRGDVIVGFNGQQVDDPSQLFRLVADAAIGSTATVNVLRDGRSSELKVPIVSSSRNAR